MKLLNHRWRFWWTGLESETMTTFHHCSLPQKNRAELCRDRLGALRAQMLGMTVRQRVRALVTQLFKTTYHPHPHQRRKRQWKMDSLSATDPRIILYPQRPPAGVQCIKDAHSEHRWPCWHAACRGYVAVWAGEKWCHVHMRGFFFPPPPFSAAIGSKMNRLDHSTWLCSVQRRSSVSCLFYPNNYVTGGSPKFIHAFSIHTYPSSRRDSGGRTGVTTQRHTQLSTSDL